MGPSGRHDAEADSFESGRSGFNSDALACQPGAYAQKIGNDGFQ
jgi:hypothetical protein